MPDRPIIDPNLQNSSFVNNRLFQAFQTDIGRNTDRITQLSHQAALIMKESYKRAVARASVWRILGVSFTYEHQKSNDLTYWLENEDIIILAYHGASGVEDSILAIRQFFTPDENDPTIRQACELYKQAVESGKKVLYIGHSLGAWIITSCTLSTNNQNAYAYLFSAYTPTKSSKQAIRMAIEPKFKKILFSNDWLATNQLAVPGATNLIVIKPYDIKTTFNGHSAGNFIGPIGVLNRNSSFIR